MKPRIVCPTCILVTSNTYDVDDQDNSFTDDKDQCDGEGADSSHKSICTPAMQTSWVVIFCKTRGE